MKTFKTVRTCDGMQSLLIKIVPIEYSTGFQVVEEAPFIVATPNIELAPRIQVFPYRRSFATSNFVSVSVCEKTKLSF